MRELQHNGHHSAAPPRPRTPLVPACSAWFCAAARAVGSAARPRWRQRKFPPWRRSKMAKFLPLRRCASVGADFGTILTAWADAPRYALLGANDKNIREIYRVPPKPSRRDLQSPTK